jgi:putative hydrolase of the HAD superfamily
LQGTACYDGAATALQGLAERGISQGVIAEGQCFTLVQLQRGLTVQDPAAKVDALIDKDLRALSFEVGSKKPSDRLFKTVLTALGARGIEAHETLHVGSRIAMDIVPAKKLGMRTALYAGDKASLAATGEQMKDPATRPDVLVTELEQILEVVPGS